MKLSLDQLSLFEDQAYQLADLTRSIKYHMNRAAAAGRQSRQEIVDRMNELSMQAGINLASGNSKALNLPTLEKWLNPAAVGHVPSVLALTIFCQVTKNLSPIAPMLKLLGGDVMTPDDKTLRDLGKAYLTGKKVRRELKELENKL